jgi:hypothetical protein
VTELIACNDPWNIPGVLHVADDPGVLGGFYQACARCGEVLQDYIADMAVTGPSPWPPGSMVSVAEGRPVYRVAAGELPDPRDTACVLAGA